MGWPGGARPGGGAGAAGGGMPAGCAWPCCLDSWTTWAKAASAAGSKPNPGSCMGGCCCCCCGGCWGGATCGGGAGCATACCCCCCCGGGGGAIGAWAIGTMGRGGGGGCCGGSTATGAGAGCAAGGGCPRRLAAPAAGAVAAAAAAAAATFVLVVSVSTGTQATLATLLYPAYSGTVPGGGSSGVSKRPMGTGTVWAAKEAWAGASAEASPAATFQEASQAAQRGGSAQGPVGCMAWGVGGVWVLGSSQAGGIWSGWVESSNAINSKQHACYVVMHSCLPQTLGAGLCIKPGCTPYMQLQHQMSHMGEL
jgi:hypothetical protein